jgi:hypothetical protein
MRAFNATSRAKIVEGHSPQPIESTPFHAALSFAATSGASPQQSSAPAQGK